MTIRLVRPALVLLTTTLIATTTAEAGVCFRGRPKPDCSSFWITEVGIGLRFSAEKGENQLWPHSEIGWMKNVGDRYSVGITTYFVAEPKYDDLLFGLKLRGRLWLNRDLSLNVSSGAALPRSYAGHVDLNYKDLIVPYVGIDYLDFHHDIPWKTTPGWNLHAGLRGGSYAGSGLHAVAAGAFVGYIILLLNAP